MGMMKSVAGDSAGGGMTKVKWYPNGLSRTLYPGDPVVLSTHSGVIAASSGPGVRHLVAADVTAQYKEGTPIAGVLGFLMHEGGVVNSSGIMNAPSVPSTKLGAREPIFALPTYPYGIAPDPTSGYTMVQVALAIPGQVFKVKLGGGGTTTATHNLVGTLAGIDISGTTFTLDTSETYKPFRIVGWDPNDTSYVFAEILPSYSQYETGVSYSTQ